MGKPKKKGVAKKKNAAIPMRKLKGSTGWISGDAFRISRKKGGGVEVLVKRSGKKKRSKRSR